MPEQDQNVTIESLQRKLRIYKAIVAALVVVLLGILGGYLAPRLVKPTYEIAIVSKEGRRDVLAAAESQEIADRVLAEIKDDKSRGMGRESEFIENVEVRRAYFSKIKLTAPAELKSLLSGKLSLKAQAALIVVGGNPAVAVPTEADAKAAIEKLKQKYVGDFEPAAEPTFKEKVTVEKGVVDPAGMCQTVDEAVNALISGGEQGSHTVKNGEIGSKIARQYGMSIEQLAKLNPGRNIDRLSIGDVLKIGKSGSQVTVVTSARSSYTREIPFQTRVERNPDIYVGKESITQQGRPGKHEMQQLITYENGVEVQRVTESTKIISRPRDQVRTVGTKERVVIRHYSRRHSRRR